MLLDVVNLVSNWFAAQVLKIFNLALIVVLAVIAYQLLTRLLQRRILKALIRSKDGRPARLEYKARTAVHIGRDIVKYTILVIAGYMVLREFGLDLTPVLATISIVGIAVSFGAQSVVRDVLTGLSLFVEDQLNIGDFVEIVGVAGAVGVVEEFGLRATRLRDIHGDVHFIPNGQIGAINHYHRGFVTYHVDVTLPPPTLAEDSAVVRRELHQLAVQLGEQVPLIVGRPWIADLDSFDTLVRLVVQTVPTAGWVVEKELAARVKALLGRRFPESAVGEPVVYRVSPELLAYRQRITHETAVEVAARSDR